MTTKNAKYGKAYNTPIGLQEDNYYEMMYDLMDYVNEKGLTTRQAQKLFTDCADMILDVQIHENKSKLNVCENIIKSLESIAYSLDYFVFNDKRAINKSHSIPD